MLSFNYAIRQSVQADGRLLYGFYPGGTILSVQVNEGGGVVFDRMNDLPEWAPYAKVAGMGDSFLDDRGRVGYNRSDPDQKTILNVRVRKRIGVESDVRYQDAFQSFPADGVSVHMGDPNVQDNGHSFPTWTLDSIVGGGYDTGATADWPWDQQDNLTQAGESTISPFIRTIQESYIPGMAYTGGAIATRRFGLLLRQVADVYNQTQPAFDPQTGRRYLGFWITDTGASGRVKDLTPAQARQLAQTNGFRPPEDSILVASDQSHSWNWMKPIGIVSDTTVKVSGVMTYIESYQRTPTSDEWPYLLNPQRGATTQTTPFANDEPPTQVVISRGYDSSQTVRRPVTVRETRTTFVFCVFDVSAAGISNVQVVGRTSSRSYTATIDAQGGNVSQLAGSFHPLSGGGFLVVIPFNYGSYGGIETPEDENSLYRRDGKAFPTRLLRSPKGWRVPVIVTQIRTVPASPGQEAQYADAPGFRPTLFYPNIPDGAALAPPKPDGWNDATDGPWTPPPNDIDYSQIWRGNKYRDRNTGEIRYGTENNADQDSVDVWLLQKGAFVGFDRNPMLNGAFQGYSKQGQFVIGRFELNGQPFFSTHLATMILPGTDQTSEYARIPEKADPDGFDPAIRILQFPGTQFVVTRRQFGDWMVSTDGAQNSVPSPIDFGNMAGTVVVAARVQPPRA